MFTPLWDPYERSRYTLFCAATDAISHNVGQTLDQRLFCLIAKTSFVYLVVGRIMKHGRVGYVTWPWFLWRNPGAIGIAVLVLSIMIDFAPAQYIHGRNAPSHTTCRHTDPYQFVGASWLILFFLHIHG
jgi:hypothetical protein